VTNSQEKRAGLHSKTGGRKHEKYEAVIGQAAKDSKSFTEADSAALIAVVILLPLAVIVYFLCLGSFSIKPCPIICHVGHDALHVRENRRQKTVKGFRQIHLQLGIQQFLSHSRPLRAT
jgi:hypothetical protein